MIVAMRAPREIVIAEDGTLSADGAPATELLSRHAGRYRIVEGPPGVLMLERSDGAQGNHARVLAMGEIIGKTTMLELITMIMNNGWRGELSVFDGAHTRRLTIDQGALKTANSDVPSERLGEVMVSLGVITPDQLARCVLSTSRERRFGEIAVEMGFVDQKLLFQMLHAQAERIFSASLLVTDGRYVFCLPPDDPEAPTTQLHLPLQTMLFESVQRIDEMAHFRERIPSGDMRPVLTDAASRISFGESLRPVAVLADGQHSIVDIGRELRIDEFEATKKVMQLLQIGCVELREQQTLNRESVDRIVKQLNEVMREIRDTVERHGGSKGVKQMLWTLQAWIRDTEIGRYFDDAIKLNGDVSTDATLKQLNALHLQRPLEELHRAAHELVSFAMFCATPTLTREAERALSKWVNQRLSRMRL
jgi:flagellar biosynthesis regulator FlbT